MNLYRGFLLWLLSIPLLFATSTAQGQLVQQDTGLTGYLFTPLSNSPAGYEYGFGFYSSVHTLQLSPTRTTQLGWTMWVIPENDDFESPLCPVGTLARDNWPERGPTWVDVFQTMEGGVGQWVSTRFPSTTPKFRHNLVPDCYDNQVATAGWSFHAELLPDDKLGIAQLSNRLLFPPDGFAFTDSATPVVVGYAWIALPLIRGVSPLEVPTGNQSWTLFLNAANFKGPASVATPALWSAVSALDPTIYGRGHDARPGVIRSVAIEVGNLPMFTSQDGGGTRYRRVPQLLFPEDASGNGLLILDVRYYSKAAIWDPVASWIAGGSAPTAFEPSGIHAPTLMSPISTGTLGGEPINYGSSFGGVVYTNDGGGRSFGMRWSGLDVGAWPEYFRETNGTWRPVPAAEVPPETNLASQTFDPAPIQPVPSLNTSSTSPWTSEKWAAGPFTVELTDGSVVEYVWYKFVDQPAIARLPLIPRDLERLQEFVETLHDNTGVDGFTMPPPSSGELATIDPELIVTPPAGLERGYVPIAIKQSELYVAPSQDEIDALTAIYSGTRGFAWIDDSGWLSGRVDDWVGVTVSGGRVIELKLPGNNLAGTLPPEIGDLPHLEVLDLAGNEIGGPIPAEIGNLTSLRVLELSRNQLSGPIPDTVGNLTKLTFFSVWNNQLNGTIPASFGNLASLDLLQLGANSLSGPIPATIGQLGALRFLFLAVNQLSGELPTELGDATQLLQLDLNTNPLSGPLPLSLQNLGSLSLLSFQNSQLCEPPSTAFQAWLAGVPNVTTTGVTCTCNPASCVDSGPCLQPGVCDADLGWCTRAPEPDGTTCDDFDADTCTDVCLDGVCTGAEIPEPLAIDDSARFDRVAGMDTLSWVDLPGPYNLYRGTGSVGQAWVYDQTCWLTELAVGSAIDEELPPSGSFFYYLVSRVDECRESVLGTDSVGNVRPNGAPCAELPAAP